MIENKDNEKSWLIIDEEAIFLAFHISVLKDHKDHLIRSVWRIPPNWSTHRSIKKKKKEWKRREEKWALTLEVWATIRDLERQETHALRHSTKMRGRGRGGFYGLKALAHVIICFLVEFLPFPSCRSNMEAALNLLKTPRHSPKRQILNPRQPPPLHISSHQLHN